MKKAAYRPCVGVMLVNAEGKAFVGRRIDNKEGDWWQMPQGGVDPGEDLQDAALRELAEETGVRTEQVSLIGKLEDTIRYDLPEELVGKLWGGKYVGQEQTWFLARFSGSDDNVNLKAHDPPEFCDYRWVDPEELPDLIVPFKKRVYRAVLEGFRELI
jgi:putative (di)nucleoside polyphosphate hydrolase